MREALFILIVLLILLALTAFKFRRHILSMIQVWRMLKQLRSGGMKDISPNTQKSSRADKKGDVPLVKCTRCGSWTPEDEATILGGKIAYCSTGCVELSVETH